ncbi:MAG: hypothetical protein B5M48_00810 [Candidatus Omnitrophica bacterium 4484_213]|nr:MAG: hypothetical protein B5M48_00810 [Candidatus Omnitrophica bacterium 4484_213]
MIKNQIAQILRHNGTYPVREVLFLFTLAGVLFFSSLSYAFWLWSPSSGKWENPKYPPIKENAQKQFEFAKQLFEKGDYQRARDEFKRLLKRYPDSVYAYKGEFLLGKVYESLKRPYLAFQTYKDCVANYPYGDQLEDIAERECRIGEFFLEQEVRKVLGLELSLPQEKAIEIFKEIRKQAPYTEWGALAQYKLGICYQRLKKWKEAIAEFNRFINEYPEHSKVVSGDANYQIALSYSESILNADYDQKRTAKAIKYFKDFVIDYPQNEKIKDAKEKIVRLEERVAEGLFKSASFYRQQGYTESARTYYNEIIDKYGETSWARKAEEELEKINQMSNI